MNAFVARGLRPLQCVLAMVGGGFLSSPMSALVGSTERLTRTALLLAGKLRLHEFGARRSRQATEAAEAAADAPRFSRVEPVKSPFRRADVVDQASWESFPASDPPGY